MKQMLLTINILSSKICSKCKIEKELCEFSKYKDGFQSTCKICQKEYQRINKIKTNEYKKTWREKNKEILKEKYSKEYYQKYRENNKEHINQNQKNIIIKIPVKM